MARLKVKELQRLRMVLAVLATGLLVVIGFVIRREVIRSQALKNIGKNTIEVAITKTGNESKETVSGPSDKKSGNQADNGDNKKTKSYIEERLTWIYSNALKGVEGDKKMLEIANKCKSAKMRGLEKQCSAVEQSEPGYLRDWYLDCVDWVFTQDMKNPRLASVSVKSITKNRAEATVVIDFYEGSGSMQHVDLWLVYENNDWFIDDFQPDEYKEFKHTVRGDMDAYLKSHKTVSI